MSRIRDLLDRQAVDLGHLQDREARRVLRAFEDARRDLRARLSATSLPASEHQIRVVLAQTDAAILALQDRMGQALDAGARASQERALQNLVQVIDRQERTFALHGAEIDIEVLSRLTQRNGLALHKYAVGRYGRQVIANIQRELVAGYAAGLTPHELARRIAGTGGVLARHAGRAELIARMELARAYDEGHQISLEETAVYDDPDTRDPLLKRADEFFDARNHPFSLLLHGRAVRPRQEWEVPLAPGTRGGLVWQVTGRVAHGFGYPAHYNERGRQVPWRASWGGGTYTPQRSFRQKLTQRQQTALRLLSRGAQLAQPLSPAARRKLELAGYLDGQGRVTREGRLAAQT